ncbi:MAG: hypothetical protein K2O18_13750 [Oscillospiraceae bacterium]|nr:hypothetical protein [Oscillospiraceae bacterium]
MAEMQAGIRKPGEIAKMQSPGRSKLDEIFWRDSTAIPALCAGQRRVWGGNPNKIDQGDK